MQQLLKGQETRFAEGLRVMKSRLSTLHASLAKATPEPPAGESPLGPTQALEDTGVAGWDAQGCDGWRFGRRHSWRYLYHVGEVKRFSSQVRRGEARKPFAAKHRAPGRKPGLQNHVFSKGDTVLCGKKCHQALCC